MELNEFIKKSKNIKLNKSEKAEMRQSIFNFISKNPVRSNMEVGLGLQSRRIFWDWSTLFNQKINFISVVAILLLIIILTGGGVAVGAEKALPGDVLYPVKISVNEEVRSWFSISEEAKANWEIKRAERRLEEAEKLAEEGSLNDEVRGHIEANFEAHSQKVKERVEKFRTKENFDAAASLSLNFETALKAHDKVLSNLARTKNSVKVQVKPIRQKIHSEVNDSAKERRTIEIHLKSETDIKADGDENSELENEKWNDEFELELKNDLDGGLNLNLNQDSINSSTRVRAGLRL